MRNPHGDYNSPDTDTANGLPDGLAASCAIQIKKARVVMIILSDWLIKISKLV